MHAITLAVTDAARIEAADIRGARWDGSDLVYDTTLRGRRARPRRAVIRLTRAVIVSSHDCVSGEDRPATWDELGLDRSTGERFRGGGRWAFSGAWMAIDSERVGFQQEFSDNPEHMVYAASFDVACAALQVSTHWWAFRASVVH